MRTAPRPASLASRLGAALARAGAVLRTIAGVPDYERYLAHMRTHHPGEHPLSRDAFARRRLSERYEKPGGKCC